MLTIAGGIILAVIVIKFWPHLLALLLVTIAGLAVGGLLIWLYTSPQRPATAQWFEWPVLVGLFAWLAAHIAREQRQHRRWKRGLTDDD